MAPAYLHTYLPLYIKRLVQHTFILIPIGIGMLASFGPVFAKSPEIPTPPRAAFPDPPGRHFPVACQTLLSIRGAFRATCLSVCRDTELEPRLADGTEVEAEY